MNAPIIRSLSDLRAMHADWVKAGDVVGLVPTMGALHEGHLSLVQTAKAACDRVIVTIFVNPKQFNNPEDLEKYPRTEDLDAAKLRPFAVDAVFVPEAHEIYPEGFATTVSVGGVSDTLEGAFRPGHFDGVATVVAKLFLMTGADKAFFGEKDFQQLMLVRRMAKDLNIPIEVVGCPTVREASGLAMSSRNLRLSEAGKQKAATMHQLMKRVAKGIAEGGDWASLQQAALAELEKTGFGEVEYFELRSAETLAPVQNFDMPMRLLVAAWCEGVRLIDNIPVDAC